MKTSAILRAAGAALLLAPVLPAIAAQTTTYQVDMSVQVALGNFNPATDTVFVSGNFSTPNWLSSATDGSTNYILTAGAGNVYSGTFGDAMAVGSFENHKFVINPGGNFSALMWESIGNRFFQVPTGATNLAVVFFNDVTNVSSSATVSVTFQVNLGPQMQLGNFNPATDFAFVAGDAINNWSSTASMLSQSVTDTNIWEGTFEITDTVGSTVNYKFIMNTFAAGVTWENNGVGPNGAQNRQFVFPSTATNLPSVYFNNVTNASSEAVAPITFTVNMIVQNALGNFTPGVDNVFVAGDAINNWAAGASQLTQSLSDPNVYSGTFSATNLPGSAVSFKFELNSGASWESINNRQFPMPTVASNLPAAYWNDVPNLGTLSVSNNGAGQAVLRWNGGARTRLQYTTNPATGWLDLPNTQGSNSATVNLTGKNVYRVVGP